MVIVCISQQHESGIYYRITDLVWQNGGKMIYTVTFNPSLDCVLNLEEFRQGEVNRTVEEQILPGGKGINVSMVLNNLGVENTALGFIAGFTGKEIQRRVLEHGCRTDFIEIGKSSPYGTESFSRINVKLKADVESEINGQGPDIGTAELNHLYQKLDNIQEGDILVLAGSIPASLPASVYMEIMKRVGEKKQNVKIVVDATGKLLLSVLKYHPFLIKPNKHELGEIFGVNIVTEEDVAVYAAKLREMGAENVLISLAGEGALLISEHGIIYRKRPPEGEVVNSVGAGDSMVAGFLAGYLEKRDYEYALKMGLAAGSASAFSKFLATKEEVMELIKDIG